MKRGSRDKGIEAGETEKGGKTDNASNAATDPKERLEKKLKSALGNKVKDIDFSKISPDQAKKILEELDSNKINAEAAYERICFTEEKKPEAAANPKAKEPDKK